MPHSVYVPNLYRVFSREVDRPRNDRDRDEYSDRNGTLSVRSAIASGTIAASSNESSVSHNKLYDDLSKALQALQQFDTCRDARQ